MVESVKEYVRTADGEVIPRGPIGERSVYTTPQGRIINLDLEGLPVQLGPKPEIIRIKPEAAEYSGGFEEASGSTEASQQAQGNFNIDDFPIFKKNPWLLGGNSEAAQEAGMRQLEKLVHEKDSVGFYEQFERPGYTLNFMDKVYIESTILQDTARQQKLDEEVARDAARQKAIDELNSMAKTEPVAVTPPPIVEPVAIEPAAPLIQGEAVASITAIGASQSLGELLPGVTTFIILITFAMTLYKVYKYVQQLTNSKVTDYEGFADSARFINRSQNPAAQRAQPQSAAARQNGTDDSFAPQDTFEFDASEVGTGAMTCHDYEQYTGGEDFASCDSVVFSAIEESKTSNPADGEANAAIQNLDKILEGSQVTQRGEYW